MRSRISPIIRHGIQTKIMIPVLMLLITLATKSIDLMAKESTDKIPHIGILFIGDRNQPHLEAFKQGLRELGYTEEDKNIALHYRYAQGRLDRLPALARELVQLKVDVIVTTSGNSARAAAGATKTIPIVLTTGADPVKAGLAESLAKPGRNITGLSIIEEDLSGKRVEILKETFPKIMRLAYLWNPLAVSYSQGTTSGNPSYDEAEKITKTLGVQLLAYGVRSLAEIEKAFVAMLQVRPQALLVLQSPLMTLNSKRIVELALEQHLPGIYPSNQFAQEGGLIAYGPVIADLYRRAATYVDKILKGAKPADLPIEQPTKFELVINLKAAKQIGVTIPPNVLARADRVIR